MRALVHPLRLSLVLLLLGGLSACAKRLPDASPDQIPELEASLAAGDTDPLLRTQLGVAYYKAGQYDAAEEMLTESISMGSEESVNHLYLGLTREAREDWGGAREAYGRYVELGRFDPLREEMEARLALMVQQELQTQARQALAQEDQLSTAPPESGTLAVFPFRVVAGDGDLDPLGLALSDMMITDLTLSGGVTVLERTRVQTLLDEMAMTEAGFTEEGTGARAGRMLRAENVVQGALTPVGENDIRFDAGVLLTEQRQIRGQFSNQSQLDQIFELEKELVFQTLDVLGVQITAAEREAIDNNRSRNVLGFLAYGRGLQALDEGNYSEAQAAFQEANSLDPGFVSAAQKLDEANQLQRASTQSTDDLAQAAVTEVTGVQIPTETPLLASLTESVVPNPGAEVTTTGGGTDGGEKQGGERDPTQEASGNEGVTNVPKAQIKLVIPNPTNARIRIPVKPGGPRGGGPDA
jgi:tetratricopeptide (TPR) repeat protein